MKNGKGTPWLTAMSTDDIDTTIAALDFAQNMVHKAIGSEPGGLWWELMDLMDDLDASWWKVWPAERARAAAA